MLEQEQEQAAEGRPVTKLFMLLAVRTAAAEGEGAALEEPTMARWVARWGWVATLVVFATFLVVS